MSPSDGVRTATSACFGAEDPPQLRAPGLGLGITGWASMRDAIPTKYAAEMPASVLAPGTGGGQGGGGAAGAGSLQSKMGIIQATAAAPGAQQGQSPWIGRGTDGGRAEGLDAPPSRVEESGWWEAEHKRSEVRVLRGELEDLRDKASRLELKVAQYRDGMLASNEELHKIRAEGAEWERKAKAYEAELAAARTEAHGKMVEREWAADHAQRQAEQAAKDAKARHVRLQEHTEAVEADLQRVRAEAAALRAALDVAKGTVGELQRAQADEASHKAKKDIEVQGLAEAADKAGARILELDSLIQEYEVRVCAAEGEAAEARGRVLALEQDLHAAVEERALAQRAAAEAQARADRAESDARLSMGQTVDDLKVRLGQVEQDGDQVRGHNKVLAQLLEEAQAKLSDADVLVSSLQTQAENLRALNDNYQLAIQQANARAVAADAGREEATAEASRLRVELEGSVAAREEEQARARAAKEAESRALSELERASKKAEEELALERSQVAAAGRREEDRVRVLDDAMARQRELVAHVQAMEAAREEDAAVLRKQVVRAEGSEARAGGAEAQLKALEQVRREDRSRYEQKLLEMQDAVKAEQERAVRSDAKVNALLEQLAAQEKELADVRAKATAEEAAAATAAAAHRTSEAAAADKVREGARLQAEVEQLQKKAERLEAALALERGRVEGKDQAVTAAQEQRVALETRLETAEASRHTLLAQVKQLELEKMELHTGVSISQAAAAQAHDREQAAAEAQRLAQARVETLSCS